MMHTWKHAAGLLVVMIMASVALVSATSMKAIAEDKSDRPGKRARKIDHAGLLEKHPELDSNGDGQISNEEWRAGRDLIRESRRAERAKRILQDHPEADKDGDGKLSKEESEAFRRPPGDGPHRGRRTEDRRGARLTDCFDWLLEHFAEADLDRNGELSKTELEQIKKQHADRDRVRFGRDRRSDKGGRLHERLLERFPEADSDGDGKMSDEELSAFKEKHPRGGRGNRSKWR